MPDKSGRMTHREAAFKQHFVEGESASSRAVSAATKAGYPHPRQAASRLLAHPAINASILAEQQRILNDEILPLAVSTLRDLLQPTTPAGARVQAVKVAFDRTLGSDDGKAAKELHEMTLEELDRERQRLLDERANLAKVIEHDPGENAQSAPNSGADTSLFD